MGYTIQYKYYLLIPGSRLIVDDDVTVWGGRIVIESSSSSWSCVSRLLYLQGDHKYRQQLHNMVIFFVYVS